MNSKGYFITGTDTGVGKTVATAFLAHFLKSRNQSVGVMKPIETGVDPHCSSSANSDALFLMESLGVPDPLEMVSPLRFKTPASPFQVQHAEGVRFNLDGVMDAYRKLIETHSTIVVEGMGGLLSPITAEQSVADLVKIMKLPVIIVTTFRVGTLNQTLVTLEAAQSRGLHVAGIVFNHNQPEPLDEIEMEQPAVLKELTEVPTLFKLPFLDNLSPESFTPEFLASVSETSNLHMLD